MNSPIEVLNVIKPMMIEFRSNLLSALIVDCLFRIVQDVLSLEFPRIGDDHQF